MQLCMSLLNSYVLPEENHGSTNHTLAIIKYLFGRKAEGLGIRSYVITKN